MRSGFGIRLSASQDPQEPSKIEFEGWCPKRLLFERRFYQLVGQLERALEGAEAGDGHVLRPAWACVASGGLGYGLILVSAFFSVLSLVRAGVRSDRFALRGSPQ